MGESEERKEVRLDETRGVNVGEGEKWEMWEGREGREEAKEKKRGERGWEKRKEGRVGETRGVNVGEQGTGRDVGDVLRKLRRDGGERKRWEVREVKGGERSECG